MKHLTLLLLGATLLVACKKDDDQSKNVPFNIVGEWEVNGQFKIWLKADGLDGWESNSAFGYSPANGYYEYRNDSLIIKVSRNGFGTPTYIYDSIRPANDNTYFNCRIADYNGDTWNKGLPCKFTRIR